MNFLNREKDNIISIVKLLKPISYLYSKQNKDYDKFFRSSSLKGLIKQINSQPKYNELLKPGESLEELNNHKNTNIFDVNFKSTFNYIDELSNLKNLPLVLLNKKLLKKGKFNNDYEEKSLNSGERKKKKKEEQKNKKKERISQIKNSGDAEVTLDPGRYHPNYNFIKRRYPCAYLGKPKPKEDSFHKDINNNNQEEDEVKKTSGQNNNENTNYNENISNRNIKIRNKNNKKINSNNFNKKKIMNYSSSNFYSMAKSISNENTNKKPKNETKKNKINFAKEHNTVSSWSHSMNLEKSKKLNEQNRIINNDKSKTNYNYHTSQKLNNLTKFFIKNSKQLNKNNSAENLRCPIIFDKMPGRDRPINFVDGGWEGCRTNYNPDYNIIRPHIPSTIFKCKRKYQNFKKYITGKIIRSYCYSPDRYFVFEIKENNKKEIYGNYGTIILKS